ncbi:MAG: stage III sporulation protein AE [Lachnospiraceae bacterium]
MGEYENNIRIIEELLEEAGLAGEYCVTFRQMMASLLKGEVAEVATMLSSHLKHLLLDEFLLNKQALLQILLLVIVTALFSNVSVFLRNAYTAETGFLVTYMVLFGIVSANFFVLWRMTESVIRQVVALMKVLLPVFCLTLTATTGLTTATASYQFFLILIAVLEWGVRIVILPGCSFYVLLQMVNYLDYEESFRYLADFLEKGIVWMLRAAFAVVAGTQAIQGILLPAIDSIESGALQKGIRMIPGIGNSVSGVLGALVGSSVVIKNCVGVAGVLLLFVLIAVPVVKLVFFFISYQLLMAVLGPVADRRVLGCLGAAATGGKLLFQSLVCVAGLFFVSIAIIAYTTNMRV